MNVAEHSGDRPRAASAVGWSATQGIGSTLIHFATLAALSRLLEPTVFGIMSILLVVHNIANLFAQMGLSSAVIQRSNLSQSGLHSLYWLNIALGCLVTLSLILLSPLISAVFDMPVLVSTICVIALTFFVSCWSIQYQSMAQRQLKFRRIALINIFALLSTAVVSITMAYLGYGIWSLVAGVFAATIVRSLSFFIAGVREIGLPKWHFNWSEAREMTIFGAHRFGAMFVNAINSNVDQLLVGGLFGAQALGYYNVAIRIVMQPIDRINPIVTRVAFPWLSRVQHDDKQVNETYLKIISALTAVNAPLLVAAGVLAEFYIPLLLGDGWTPVIALVQILSAYALLRTIINAGASLILAKGRADWTFYWNLALLLVFPAGLYVAAQFGDVRFMAFALLVLQSIVLLAYHRFLIYPLTGITFGHFIREAGKPFLCALLAGAAAFGAIWSIGLPGNILNLAIGTLVGGASYALLFKFIIPEHYATLRQILSRRQPKVSQ